MSVAALRASPGRIAQRIEAIDWDQAGERLDTDGFAVLGPLLTLRECAGLVRLYDADESFRSRVVMSRHNFGRGEYKYFRYPLPDIVQRLREGLFSRLVQVANRWNEALGSGRRYPATHGKYLARCSRAGQRRPTPLLLRYEAGDYNCLHQDLYGEEVFPLQVAILLSAPGEEFSGGELVLTEQRPRAQSRPHVVALGRGDAIAFAVHQRPVRGTRGYYRVNMRHGVSRLHAGRRTTLGIIFHDAA